MDFRVHFLSLFKLFGAISELVNSLPTPAWLQGQHDIYFSNNGQSLVFMWFYHTSLTNKKTDKHMIDNHRSGKL
jgi:hypothetical protein